MINTLSGLAFFLGCALLLLPACGTDAPQDSAVNREAAADSTAQQQTERESTTSEPFTADEQVYTWVDKLNIRDLPKLDGKVVAQAATQTPLRFTGEQSEASETIVLRGVVYQEPWMKVVTPEGTEGWVFGGAVKHEGEVKGNQPITDQTFSFPVFGSYDLADWKKLSTQETSEEVDYQITTYQKGDQLLEITQADMGEFYYGWTYKLMNIIDKVVIKERQFSFTAQDPPFMLEETVKDYSTHPPMLYRRTQNLDQHYYRLNARPMMAVGPWEKSSLAVIPE